MRFSPTTFFMFKALVCSLNVHDDNSYCYCCLPPKIKFLKPLQKMFETAYVIVLDKLQ